MPAVISHVIGTVALLSMMLVMANIFTAFGGFVTNKAYEVELDETASYVANHINQLIGVANFSNGGYLLKDLNLPDDIGKFAYRISIEGPPPPLSLGTIIINNPASTDPFSNGWIKTQFGFESDNKRAEGGNFPAGWWNSNYLYRLQITISNPSSSLLPAGYSVKININTTGSEFLPNGDDVRIVYDPTGTELDRINETPFNSVDTEIWFQSQADIPGTGSDNSYYVYYGHAGASNPPADRSQVYLWYDDFSTDTSSNYNIARHANSWHGTSAFLPYWDPVELAVFFDTADNFSGGWQVNGLVEDDVYVEVKMKMIGSYPINTTNGLLVRWQDNSEFYAGHVSGGSYSGSPCLSEDGRSNTISCISLPSEYHPFDQWFTLAVAVWDNDLALWVDGVQKVSGTDFSISSPGKVSFIAGQSIGWIDDFKIRKFRDPEPTFLLGSEESGEWAVFSGFNIILPPNSVINYVKVISEHFEDSSGKTFLQLQVSEDGGLTFASSSHSLPTREQGNEGNDTIDITSDTVWTAENLDDIAVRFSVSSRSPAELAYKSKSGLGIEAPKVRELEGDIWGPQVELQLGDDHVWTVRVAHNPIAQSEYIVVTLKAGDEWLDAYVCNSGTCAVTEDIGRVEDFSDDSSLPFDIEYEFATGRAILVYAVRDSSGSRDLAYKIWDGGSWSSETYLDDTSSASNLRYRSIALAQQRSSGSDILGLVGFESDGDDIQAWRWNGTQWEDEIEITSTSSTTSSPYRQNVAIAFESLSGDLIAIGGHGSSGDVSYAIHNGSVWTGPWTFDTNGGGGSTVTIDNITTNQGNDNSFTHSHTVSGSNRLLVVAVELNDGEENVAGVTYAGISMNLVSRRGYDEDESPRVEVYSLTAPPLGSHDVVVTIADGDSDRVTIGSISYNGVDQSIPIDGISSREGYGANPSITISSEVGDLVQDAMANLADGSVNPPIAGGGQTERWNEEMGGSGSSNHFSTGSTKAGGSSVTMSWTLSQSRRWVNIGFNINSAIGGSLDGDVEMLTLKPNPVNDEMMLVVLTDDRNLYTARWTADAWDYVTNHSIQLESQIPRGADGDWESDGARYVLFYGKRDAGEISRKIFDGGWGVESNQVIAPLDEIEWVTVTRNPDPSANAKILVVLMYESLDLYSFSWTGTGIENIRLITSSMQDLNYEGFDLAFKPGGSATKGSVDMVSVEVSYKVQEVPPPSTGETYVIVVKSDIIALRTGNFTLPWNAYGRIVFLSQMPLPEGVSLQELPSGIRKPFLWTFVNSTHIAFGFGSR